MKKEANIYHPAETNLYCFYVVVQFAQSRLAKFEYTHDGIHNWLGIFAQYSEITDLVIIIFS